MKLFGRKAQSGRQPLLQTERLVLRAFDKSDAISVYAYAQSEKVGQMAGFAPHHSMEDSRQMVEALMRSGEHWAIVEKSTGRLIGSISLQKDGSRTLDDVRRMGYVLGESHWGQGYATEAAREVLRYAFEELNCSVISAGYFPFNQKSKRVLKKLGFAQEGVLRHARQMPDGSVSDLVVCSLLQTEYFSQKTSK